MALIKKIKWLLPMISLYSVFILYGSIHVIIESLGYIPELGLNRISLDAYIEIISEKNMLKSLVYSLYIAGTSSLLATSLGVFAAYALTKSKYPSIIRISKRIFRYGLALPYIYMAFLTIVFIGRTGLVSRLLYNLGIITDISQFPQILYNASGIGIILVFVLKGVPFVTLFVVSVMQGINEDLERAATTLGASKIIVFRQLYLPLSSNSIVWSSTILFVYYLGAFEIPYLLATNNETLSVRLYSMYISPHIQTIPNTMAMNVLMFILGSLGAYIYATILRKGIKWQRKL